MENKEITRILQKYQSGEALTTEEQRLVDSFYLHTSRTRKNEINREDLDRNLLLVEQRLQESTRPKTIRIRTWWYAAASILLLVSFFAYYTFKLKPEQYLVNQKLQLEQIKGGADMAILELANGQTIQLEGSEFLINSDESIAFGDRKISNAPSSNEEAWNTLIIPNKGQFKVALSDGTQVWLNAGSKLRYPSKFATNERQVELVGEGYFEVKHNPKWPFKVQTKEQQVHVLGTGFNVQAYTDAATQTTLAHGKVKVVSSNNPMQVTYLQPGEQARSSATILEKKSVDPQVIAAWRTGIFKFNRTSLNDITQQLARWYDVEFIFQDGKTPYRMITGEIPRDINLYDVAEILSYFDIQCEIEGRKVYLKSK